MKKEGEAEENETLYLFAQNMIGKFNTSFDENQLAVN
jgi:hypothetical protein